MSRILSLFAICTLMLLPTAQAHAFLASVKAAGTAMAGVAHPHDSEAAAINPANISFLGDRMDIGLTTVHNNGFGQVVGNAVENGTFNAYDKKEKFNPHFGFCKKITKDLTIGSVTYNRADVFTHYDHTFAVLGTTPLKLDFIQEIIAPTISYKIMPCVSVGASVNVVVQTILVRGIQNFDNGVNSSVPGEVTDNGRAYAMGVGLNLGWRWQVNPCFAVGVAFQPEIPMSRFHRYAGFLAEKGRVNVPRLLTIGFSYKPVKCVHFLFDMQHYAYNHLHALNNPLIPNLATSQLGNVDGAAFGWKDQTIFRFGAEYELFECLTLRGGFRHGRTPVKQSETAANLLLDYVIENYAAIGASYRFWNCYELSGYYAKGFSNLVTGVNSIPATLGGGNVNLRNQQDAFGFGLGRSF